MKQFLGPTYLLLIPPVGFRPVVVCYLCAASDAQEYLGLGIKVPTGWPPGVPRMQGLINDGLCPGGSSVCVPVGEGGLW